MRRDRPRESTQPIAPSRQERSTRQKIYPGGRKQQKSRPTGSRGRACKLCGRLADDRRLRHGNRGSRLLGMRPRRRVFLLLEQRLSFGTDRGRPPLLWPFAGKGPPPESLDTCLVELQITDRLFNNPDRDGFLGSPVGNEQRLMANGGNQPRDAPRVPGDALKRLRWE